MQYFLSKILEVSGKLGKGVNEELKEKLGVSALEHSPPIIFLKWAIWCSEEVAMLTMRQIVIVISGDKVLFLDPSSQHFTASNRKSRMFPLSAVQRFVSTWCRTID